MLVPDQRATAFPTPPAPHGPPQTPEHRPAAAGDCLVSSDLPVNGSPGHAEHGKAPIGRSPLAWPAFLGRLSPSVDGNFPAGGGSRPVKGRPVVDCAGGGGWSTRNRRNSVRAGVGDDVRLPQIRLSNVAYRSRSPARGFRGHHPLRGVATRTTLWRAMSRWQRRRHPRSTSGRHLYNRNVVAPG